MQNRHTRKWALDVTLGCLALAGFGWGIYEHYDDRRSSLAVTQGLSPTTIPFRNNIFEDRDKYKAEALVVDIANSGRAASRDLHLRVESAPDSWILGIVVDEDWRVDEVSSTERNGAMLFRHLSGEPRVLKARYEKLSPGLSLRVAIVYAHRGDQAVSGPGVRVYDDDGVGR